MNGNTRYNNTCTSEGFALGILYNTIALRTHRRLVRHWGGLRRRSSSSAATAVMCWWRGIGATRRRRRRLLRYHQKPDVPRKPPRPAGWLLVLLQVAFPPTEDSVIPPTAAAVTPNRWRVRSAFVSRPFFLFVSVFFFVLF